MRRLACDTPRYHGRRPFGNFYPCANCEECAESRPGVQANVIRLHLEDLDRTRSAYWKAGMFERSKFARAYEAAGLRIAELTVQEKQPADEGVPTEWETRVRLRAHRLTGIASENPEQVLERPLRVPA